MIISVFLITMSAPLEWDKLENLIRESRIEKSTALAKIRDFEPLLGTYFIKNSGRTVPRSRWCFPVSGYTGESIGGINGSGYRPTGYDFFDGNENKGHPGHDIFVNDKNQDCIDDNTGNPVDIFSVSSGIVVAARTGWKPGSKIRGGNYIWIYDTATNGYFGYAHLDSVFVKSGDIVAPCQRIATLGRTGLHAYKKRSPTHLHICYLKSVDGYPKPEDIYMDLLRTSHKMRRLMKK